MCYDATVITILVDAPFEDVFLLVSSLVLLSSVINPCVVGLTRWDSLCPGLCSWSY